MLATILHTSFHYINTFRIYNLIFLSYIVASSLDVLDNTYYDTAFILEFCINLVGIYTYIPAT